MPRYKITIEYDGTNYAGWQKQISSPNIATEIEKAIFKFSGEEVSVFGSGRTDAGVHATGQVAHFDLKQVRFTPEKIVLATNYYLKNKQIVILDASIAEDDFHARFSAKKRTYIYRILNRKAPSVIHQNRVFHVPENLDISEMQKAADLLIGQHDFTSFRASQCQAQSAIKTIDNIIIKRDGDEVILTISARSFLHHMVRNIVGSLRLVGNGRMSFDKFSEGFEACNRSLMGPTAPASGLYLVKIDYC